MKEKKKMYALVSTHTQAPKTKGTSGIRQNSFTEW